MRISTHMKITKKRFGVEAQDIHEWIDSFFNHQKYQEFLETGAAGDFNPYDHRIHRHCLEALEECIEVFRDTYPEETVRNVFESHVRSDYEGYLPCRKDFKSWEFHEKYHTK